MRDLPPWVEAELGDVRVLDARSSAVRLRLPGESGQVAWLKQLQPGQAWQQEFQAYTWVVPRLQGAGVTAPRLLKSWPEHQALLMTELPGRSGTFADPPAVFAQAGEAMAALHKLPCPPGSVPLRTDLVGRARRWASRPAAPPEAAAVVRFVTVHAPTLHAPRVWCHRDNQPRNWQIHEGRVGLLDFERLRPDHPLVDFAHLEARGWSDEQRDAYLSAFGPVDAVAARAILALYGLATATWANEHADSELLTIGEAALDRAGFSPGVK